jgi:hypothetical protein
MSPSEASSESEDEKPVKRVYKKKVVKSDALPVHPSASMPAPKFVAPAKPVVSLPPAPPAPAPKVPKVRKPRAKKLTASDPPVTQPPPQAEPAKAPEPKVEPKVETPAEPKKGRTKKIKKTPSAYNTYVGKMMKEGKTMKEASAAWRASKVDSSK